MDLKHNPLETERMRLQKKINLFSRGTTTGGQTNTVIQIMPLGGKLKTL